MKEAVANLALCAGTDYEVKLVVQDAAGEAVALSDGYLTAALKPDNGEEAALSVSVTDAAAGLATVLIPAQAIGMTAWEVWYQDDAELPRERILKGLVTVAAKVDPRAEEDPSTHRLIVRLSDQVSVSIESVDLAWWAWDKCKRAARGMTDALARLSFKVGTVLTGAAGSEVQATLRQTAAGEYVLDLTIPRGDKGETGAQGPKGDTGDVSTAENITVSGALTVGGVVNANGGINCPADLTLSGDLTTPSGAVTADELKSNEAVAEYYWSEIFPWNNTAKVTEYFKKASKGGVREYKRLPAGTPFPSTLTSGLSYTTFEELPNAWTFNDRTTVQSLLDNATNLKKLPNAMTLENAINGIATFRSTKIVSLPPNMRLPNLTNGNALFQYCAQLVDVGGLTLDNLANGNAAFYGCSKLTVVNATFDKVTDGGNMFAGCTALVSLPNVNLASLSAGGTMFYNCKALSAETIIQVLSTLKDWTGDSGTHVIRFTGSPALTDADVLAAKAGAEAKGWTVNFS